MNTKPVAGIDVSKHFSDMCILAPDNTIFAQVKIYHDLVSMSRALTFLEKAQSQFGEKPVTVMESTAHYHRLICNFLKSSGYEVIVINPLQSNALKNLNIRKVKTDKTDSLRIAQLYRLNAIKPTNIPSSILADLRDLCRQRRSLVGTRVAYTNKLSFLLVQAFPGYSKCFSHINCGSSLSLLIEFPTPSSLLQANPSEIAAVVNRGAGRRKDGKYGLEKADLLLKIAQSAILLSSDRTALESLIKIQASLIISIKENIVKLEQAIQEVSTSDKVIDFNISLLESIPGIGRPSATFLLAEIGDFSCFNKPKQLVAFCGLDPSVKQSGTMISSSNKMSKCGSSNIRAILDICTHVAIHRNRNAKASKNPVLTEYYQEKKKSKPPKVAKCACMRKMVNIIYAVLRDQKPFKLRYPKDHAAKLHTNTTQLAA